MRRLLASRRAACGAAGLFVVAVVGVVGVVVRAVLMDLFVDLLGLATLVLVAFVLDGELVAVGPFGIATIEVAVLVGLVVLDTGPLVQLSELRLTGHTA